jgi:hypothetical protein
MEEVIELRGHHIDVIAERLVDVSKGQTIPKHKEYYVYDRHIFIDADRFVYSDWYNDMMRYEGREGNSMESQGYTPQFMRKSRELHDRIITNPNLKIKIVRGFDTICKMCPKGPNGIPSIHSCDPQIAAVSGQDKSSLIEFGLVVGETYTSAEIMNKIKAYQLLNNAASPRKKAVDSLLFFAEKVEFPKSLKPNKIPLLHGRND